MPRSELREIAKGAPGWRRLVEHLHNEAELDAYDEDLIGYAVDELEPVGQWLVTNTPRPSDCTP